MTLVLPDCWLAAGKKSFVLTARAVRDFALCGDLTGDGLLWFGLQTVLAAVGLRAANAGAIGVGGVMFGRDEHGVFAQLE